MPYYFEQMENETVPNPEIAQVGHTFYTQLVADLPQLQEVDDKKLFNAVYTWLVTPDRPYALPSTEEIADYNKTHQERIKQELPRSYVDKGWYFDKGLSNSLYDYDEIEGRIYLSVKPEIGALTDIYIDMVKKLQVLPYDIGYGVTIKTPSEIDYNALTRLDSMVLYLPTSTRVQVASLQVLSDVYHQYPHYFSEARTRFSLPVCDVAGTVLLGLGFVESPPPAKRTSRNIEVTNALITAVTKRGSRFPDIEDEEEFIKKFGNSLRFSGFDIAQPALMQQTYYSNFSVLRDLFVQGTVPEEQLRYIRNVAGRPFKDTKIMINTIRPVEHEEQPKHIFVVKEDQEPSVD
jgi:hypothetical protein